MQIGHACNHNVWQLSPCCLLFLQYNTIVTRLNELEGVSTIQYNCYKVERTGGFLIPLEANVVGQVVVVCRAGKSLHQGATTTVIQFAELEVVSSIRFPGHFSVPHNPTEGVCDEYFGPPHCF